MKSTEIPIEALAKAVLDLHGGTAKWIESVPVKESFQGETVWDGTVQVFDLIGHPTASRCYAWSHITDEKSGKRKIFAVLHQAPVDSPQAAVRAAIVTEYRKGKAQG
jgi:predicted sulfurtransferase